MPVKLHQRHPSFLYVYRGFSMPTESLHETSEKPVLLAEGDITALGSCGLSLVSITGAKTMSPAAAATLAPPSTATRGGRL